MAGIRDRVEHDEPAAASEFVVFARALGEQGVDLLGHVLAGIQNVRNQRIIGDAVIEACRTNPERLAPWLSDHRAHVVRNTIQILGAIGGNAIVGLLQGVLRHPDPRVRLEVATALRGVDPKLSRPLLIRLLDGADTRMFCSVLHQLSQNRDVGTARLLVGLLLDAGFDRRPEEEKRAIYSALGATGEDEVLPDLEAEMHKGSWFTRSADAHQQAIARCIARIGTPAAKAVLEQGTQSKRAAVRKLCEDVLARWRPRE
jgi:HEAT repeat protein